MGMQPTQLKMLSADAVTKAPQLGDPWKDVELSSGESSSSAIIQKLAARVMRLQQDARALTVVVPERTSPSCDWITRELASHNLCSSDPLLLADQNGEKLMLGQLAFPKGRTELEIDTLGNFDSRYSAGLAGKLREAGNLEIRHLQYLDQLMKIPEKGLLIEIGAGPYYERLKKLDDYARSRRGHLICHDPAPAASRAAHDAVPNLPYWALPPFSQFLGSALSDAQLPKVICSKNVLTSMSPDRAADLIAICRDCKADRLVTSMSLQFITGTGAVPSSHMVDQSKLSPLLLDRIQREMIRSGVRPVLGSRFDVSIAANQAYMTFYHALTEVAVRAMRVWAKEEKVFSKQHMYLPILMEDLNPAQTEILVNIHPLGRFIARFKEGAFNTLVTGPFGFSLENQPGVPAKHFRVVQPQIHVVASNSARQSVLKTSDGNFRAIELTDQVALTPARFRWQNPIMVLMMLGMHSQEALSFIRTNNEKLSALLTVGASAAIAHLFDITHARNSWVSEECAQTFRPTLEAAFKASRLSSV